MTFTARLNLHDLFGPVTRCAACGSLSITIHGKSGCRMCASCGALRGLASTNGDEAAGPAAGVHPQNA